MIPCRYGQVERFQLVLGTGKQEPEPRLLLLMLLQKDKYEKWLFRVLLVLSEMLVRKKEGKGLRRVGRLRFTVEWIEVEQDGIEYCDIR